MSSKNTSAVLLQCNSEQHPLICKALVEALEVIKPGLNLTVTDISGSLDAEQLAQTSGLTIRYVEQRRTDDWLSGQLVWQDHKGRRVDGPLLELSIMDSTLKTSNLTSFAQTLVEISKLPL